MRQAHQHSEVGLRGPSDHVGYEALVPRRVQDCEMLLLSLKVCSSYFYSFAFVSL